MSDDIKPYNNGYPAIPERTPRELYLFEGTLVSVEHNNGISKLEIIANGERKTIEIGIEIPNNGINKNVTVCGYDKDGIRHYTSVSWKCQTKGSRTFRFNGK